MVADKTILIAAANRFLGTSIHRYLEIYGFQSAVADNSDQVVELLSQSAYQLVIFGPRFLEKLPVDQLQRIIQAIPAQTQVVILSFNDLEETMEFKPLSGHVAYQQVTANPEELIHYVQERLGSPSTSPGR